ncbi:hypothetical protein MTP99_007279 [Tenebrio molitor]|jgi:hypothetical protein|nr:hypothetical protein MTP99_007279 [Tenebrio molitor]
MTRLPPSQKSKSERHIAAPFSAAATASAPSKDAASVLAFEKCEKPPSPTLGPLRTAEVGARGSPNCVNAALRAN